MEGGREKEEGRKGGRENGQIGRWVEMDKGVERHKERGKEKENIHSTEPGLHIRAITQRNSPASLPGFTGYFQCIYPRYVKEMMFIRSHNYMYLLFTKL